MSRKRKDRPWYCVYMYVWGMCVKGRGGGNDDIGSGMTGATTQRTRKPATGEQVEGVVEKEKKEREGI